MRSHQSPGFKAMLSRVLLPRERDQREDQGLHTYLWVSGQTEVRQAGRTKIWGSHGVAVQHRLEVSYKSTPAGTQRWGRDRDGVVSAHLDLQGISHLCYWHFTSCVVEF